jgi:hypothetical protein
VSLLRATEKLRRDGATFTAALHNVADVQALSIALINVNGGGNVSVRMNVLAGDTNEDSRTNVNDTNQTKSRSGQLTDSINFRSVSLWMEDSTSTTPTSSNLIQDTAFRKARK